MKALALISRGRLENSEGVWDLIRPERDSLNKLKRISLRNKSWFNVLNLEQRKFIDAVIITLNKIHSLLILRFLAPLVGKLLAAMGGDGRKGALALRGEAACKMMRCVAERVVFIAKRWGNKSAPKWLDASFIRYLIAMSLPQNKNQPLFTF